MNSMTYSLRSSKINIINQNNSVKNLKTYYIMEYKREEKIKACI